MDVALAVPEESGRYPHRHPATPRSTPDQPMFHVPCPSVRLTAAARSSIAFPAISASSWLSLISILITCTGLLYSPPRLSRSVPSIRLINYLMLRTDPPSHTASKQRSSHVITTSAMVLLSCHRSGANLSLRLRSSICNSPFAVYLAPISPKYENSRLAPTHRRISFDWSSSYIVL